MTDEASSNIIAKHNLENRWREYQILNSSYIGTITWGTSVISIFAVFTAAMIAGAGYVGTQLITLNATNVAVYFYHFKLGDILLLWTGVVGLASAIWGPAMVLAHSEQALFILARMKNLEKKLEPIEDAQDRFAHRQLTYEVGSLASKFVKLSTVLMLFVIIAVWVAVIFRGVWLNFQN